MLTTPAVWKQYNKMAVLHFFLVNSTLIYILFSLFVSPHQVPDPEIQNTKLLTSEIGTSVDIVNHECLISISNIGSLKYLGSMLDLLINVFPVGYKDHEMSMSN